MIQDHFRFMFSGKVLFANNQTRLDLRALELDFTVSSQLIATYDDVGYHGNQSECVSSGDRIGTNTYILAATARTSDSMFREAGTYTGFSLVSYAIFMNSTTGNQGTHCIHSLAATRKVIRNNLVMFDQGCPVYFTKIVKLLYVKREYAFVQP